MTSRGSTWGQIEDAALAKRWVIQHQLLSRGTSLTLTRDKQWISVVLDRRGAITSVRVGQLRGYNITGSGKLAKLLEVLRADAGK
jgi:hypothetical protein